MDKDCHETPSEHFASHVPSLGSMSNSRKVCITPESDAEFAGRQRSDARTTTFSEYSLVHEKECH